MNKVIGVIVLLAVLSLSVLALIVFGVDPDTSGAVTKTVFWVALVVSTICVTILFISLVSFVLHRNSILGRDE
jgi:hypothetical protein